MSWLLLLLLLLSLLLLLLFCPPMVCNCVHTIRHGVSRNRVGTMFCANPGLYEDSDDEEDADDMIVRQAEMARVGGRALCALDR